MANLQGTTKTLLHIRFLDLGDSTEVTSSCSCLFLACLPFILTHRKHISIMAAIKISTPNTMPTIAPVESPPLLLPSVLAVEARVENKSRPYI